MNCFITKLRRIFNRCKKHLTRSTPIDVSQIRRSLLDIAVEEYRMRDVIMNVLGKLNPTDAPRFESRYRYFSNEVEKAIINAGFHILDDDNFIGKQFDIGMAVKPLNLKDYDTNDVLIIQQVIEPVIMEGENVARVGTVKLRREY